MIVAASLSSSSLGRQQRGRTEITQLSNDSLVHRVHVCEDTGWLTNNDEIASAFGDTWVVPECCNVKIGWPSPKVAEASLVALRRSEQQCRRGTALSLEGCLIQPALAMIEARPVLEEESLAELPLKSGELRSLGSQHRITTGSGDSRKNTTGEKGFHVIVLVSLSHRRLKSVVNRSATTPFPLSGLTSTKVTKVTTRTVQVGCH